VIKSIEKLNTELEYTQKISKINLDISFTDKSLSGLIELRQKSVDLFDTLNDLDTKRAELLSNQERALFSFKKGLSADDLQIFENVGSDLDKAIPELSEKGQKLAGEYKKTVDAVEAINDNIITKRKDQNVIFREIDLAKTDIAREGEKSRVALSADAIEAQFAQLEKDRKARIELAKLKIQDEIDLQKTSCQRRYKRSQYSGKAKTVRC
jgi:hypothetical protein